MINQLKIDDEFSQLIYPLTDSERQSLEESLTNEGCRDALIIWQGIILDGYHRYLICQKHSIKFKAIEIEFEDRAAAKIWIIKNQFARRNLTPFQRAELALKLEPLIAEKAKERQRSGGKEKVPQKSAEAGEARDELASIAGVSHDTIWKVKKILTKGMPEFIQAIREGELSISRAVEQIDKPHVAHNSGENEWYTPPDIIEDARAVMGSIDCDPASAEIANKFIKAKKYFSIEDDGLIQEWQGNIWLNPPYSQPLVTKFSETVSTKYEAEEINQACILVNNATETEWFQRMLSLATAICFIKGRVKFLNPEGKPAGAPLQGQAVLYFGKNAENFFRLFSKRGIVLYGTRHNKKQGMGATD